MKVSLMATYRKLKALAKLTRIDHGLFLVIAVLIGQIVTLGSPPNLRILSLSIFTPILISAGAFALNDYTDYEADKKNERTDRPLVTGELNRKTALYLSSLLLPLGVAVSYPINVSSFLIALIFAIISYEYAIVLKKIPLIGNLSIAASMTIPFIYGSLNVSTYVPTPIWILGTMAFLSGTGREIVKSIQDMKGDREQNRKTLPIKIGKKPSGYLAIILTLIAILIIPVPFFYLPPYLGSHLYLALVTLSALFFFISIKNIFKAQYPRFRKNTWIAICLGLIAFLAPVIRLGPSNI